MIALTYFQRLTIPHGKRVQTTWTKLLERLAVPRVSADKHDVPGLSLATYANDVRRLANVESVYAVGLDLDEGVAWPVVRDRFAGCASFVHSTWSSTLSDPRARVFILLSRPVSGDEYRRVYAYVAAKVEAGGLVVDRAASDPSRFWFLPCHQPTGAFVSFIGDGYPLDVDAALDAAPVSQPPASRPPMPARPGVAGGATALHRARAYLAHMPGAIAGSGGHRATFEAALRMVRGFSLSVDEAYSLLANEYNPRCSPPWSERDLRRKVEQAANAGRMPEGDMLARERSR